MTRTDHRPSLLSPATFVQLSWWSARQWRVVFGAAVVSFLVIGAVGQTLPPFGNDRVYPVEWWNWATLVISAVMLGLIAGTFTLATGRRVAAGAGSGAAGTAAAIFMACPVCSPLAIPLLGAGGFLSFLTPNRGWLALGSIALLTLTLLLRLRASSTCVVNLPTVGGSDDLSAEGPTGA